ncbi:MAG: radical SAM protein, partial [Gemmatimonadales bacterium]|nr:radical SAM protein [Gemmatimonadales bacterium]
SLKQVGVHGLNISIDSLRPEKFREITRGGSLEQCRAGIDAALAAGFRVKLNIVTMAGINSDEILDFVELARELPLEVRFIEYMPTRGRQADPGLTVPSSKVLDIISGRHELTALTSDLHAGPAHRFRVADWPGKVGVISPVSCHFCQDCNRIRVTASGMARSCLFHEVGLDLRPWLKRNDASGLAEALKRVVTIKPEAHNLGQDGTSGEDDTGSVFMSRLGG